MQAQRVTEKEGSPAGRLLSLDNLRSTMIILVISMHAADTHSPLRQIPLLRAILWREVRRRSCHGAAIFL